MFEVYLTDLAIWEIENFIHWYEEGFLSLYRDSGIESEHIILEGYRQIALNLKKQIFAGMRSQLRPIKVLGRKKLNDKYELDFYVADRLIVIYFSENLRLKTRTIERVGIGKRPIIF